MIILRYNDNVWIVFGCNKSVLSLMMCLIFEIITNFINVSCILFKECSIINTLAFRLNEHVITRIFLYLSPKMYFFFKLLLLKCTKNVYFVFLITLCSKTGIWLFGHVCSMCACFWFCSSCKSLINSLKKHVNLCQLFMLPMYFYHLFLVYFHEADFNVFTCFIPQVWQVFLSFCPSPLPV